MKPSQGVVLLFLGLFFKVAVAANSTKVYMLNLEIELYLKSNLIVSEILNNPINGQNATVSAFVSTTDCTYIINDSKNCSCQSGYKWPDDISNNYSCPNVLPMSCVLPAEETAVCLSETTVRIDGVSYMSNDTCDVLCIPMPEDPRYKTLNQTFTVSLSALYSTLQYFDSLVINGYSSGSVLANYMVQCLGQVTIDEIQNVVQKLTNSTVVTTGIVTINISQTYAIDIGSSVNITCKPPQPIGPPSWFLTDVNDKTTEITTGIEANLTTIGLLDIVELTNISGSWKGTLQCVYIYNSIQHTSSTKLDVALLPEIQPASNPQFPDCRTATQVKVVTECTISNDSENYTVTWNIQPNSTYLSSITTPEIEGNLITYKANVFISCLRNDIEAVYVTCTFTNNRAYKNKYANTTMEIPIIYSHSAYCNEDGDWPLTKSNFSSILSCPDYASGQNTRLCYKGVFQDPISSCVNNDIVSIQNDVQQLNKGIGFIKDSAGDLFERMWNSTTVSSFSSFANINEAVNIYDVMNNVSTNQSNRWNDTVLPTFINSASNFFNNTSVWKNPQDLNSSALPIQYLQTMERMIQNSYLTSQSTVDSFENVKLAYCNNTAGGICNSHINATVKTGGVVAVLAYRTLNELLPSYNGMDAETTILSVTSVNGSNNSTNTEMMFDYSDNRLPNHAMICVFLDNSVWSEEGCTWGGASNPNLCTCTHNSAFTILMDSDEVTLPYMDVITYVGLGISIISLLTCIIIEILVWDIVVKSDVSNFRHVAILNICLSLLFAHVGFLASSNPPLTPSNWCSILTIVKHFFFLATFFWMLCLSFVILHQMIYVFDHLRKKIFWGLSITIGYICPLLCVTVTIITFGNGQENKYYSPTTCWLIRNGQLTGSIFGFILPIGSIVFINLFTLAVVIMKIISPAVSEAKARDEKAMAKSMIKTIVFLSPVLGITWIFGFFLMGVDLTMSPLAEILNYSFTIFNSLQGFFILMTVCVGEKKIRDALRKRFKAKQSVQSKSESSGKMTSSVKK